MSGVDRPVYQQPAQPVEARVVDLMSRMTLDEKLAQIGCFWSRDLLVNGAFDPALAAEKIPHGIGQITRIGGATALLPEESAAVLNAFQRFLVEQTRLGIPAIIHEESCGGYLARGATCFPQALGQAATWDPAVVEQMAYEIRRQLLAVGARQALAPVLDVIRDPRWGRSEETYGEDPYLIGQIGSAYVRGLQTGDLADGVAATGKHFAGYGASEGGLNWAPSHIPERELREIYAAPFETAIKEAGLATVMNGYHELDGIPCGASRGLLGDLLRGEIGFEGAVVADYFTVENLLSYHHVAADQTEAARLALEAGIDIELPASVCYGEPLRQGLADGRIDPGLVDTAVANILRLKFRLGLFEKPYADPAAVAQAFETAEQRALARRVAAESIVLLKNEGDLLPLRKDFGSIAVIGPHADSPRLLQGDYHYPAHLETMQAEGPESAVPTPEHPFRGDLSELYPPMVTILAGIRAAVSAGTAVRYAQGCDVTDPSTDGFEAAVEAARQSDVAVVVVGARSGLTHQSTDGEAVDRATLDLPGVQQQLVEAVAATGTPVVVVLVNGRPLALPWIAEHIPAVLETWIPGEEGGSAVADVLFGELNPAGRLPVSMPRGVGQVPLYYNHKPSGGRSHWYGDYVDMSVRPLYPFGHGLSYTTFAYSDLQIAPRQPQAHDLVRISVVVTNTGPRAGDEVVQLYVRDTVASVTRPVQQLVGFKRLHLQPGERRTLTFHLAVSQLGFFDARMRYVVEPGAVVVMVGASCADIRQTGCFEIEGPVSEVGDHKVYTTPVEVS